MGWPEQTPLLKTFYPTAVLVTGFDILFFWVARMMMMGLQFMEDVPFRDVYVHALVRDEEGKKMSKSKGNVIDPLTVIEQYGTDAFRFTLAAFAAQGRDVKMSEKRVAGYRNFVNKLWNATRFALMHLDRGFPEITAANRSLPDRWILSRLSRVRTGVREALDGYHFNDAASALYQFVWHEFCDWYLEAVKPILYGHEGEERQAATLSVLWNVMRETLLLLHPFVPFVTEEIWHRLPGTEGSIMQASLEDGAAGQRLLPDPEAEARMERVVGVITAIRTIRGEMNIQPGMALAAAVQSESADVRATLKAHQGLVATLARLKTLEVSQPGERPKTAATAIVPDATVFVSLEGIIDFAAEKARLEKEIQKVIKELNAVSRKLTNEDFLSKAPADVVEKVRGQHAELVEKEGKLQANLERVAALAP
ncbi:MAG: class I tRNA ligase family protein, partial [Desulfobacteraceae bacterium]|jgi:valyl-tRNA synthetase